MNVIQIYAITAEAIFSLMLMIRAAFSFVWFLWLYSILLVKHFLYLNILWWHCFFEPCTQAQVLLYLLYLTVKIFCSTFKVFFIRELGTWMRTLSLINMISLYFGYHLNFTSDMLGLFIINYWRIHASTKVMSVFLSLFHTVVSEVSVTNSILFSAFNQLVEFIVKLWFFLKWYKDWCIFSGCDHY